MANHESQLTAFVHRLTVWAFALLFVMPFAWIVLTSFKPESQIYKIPLEWWPQPFTLTHYARVLFEFPLLIYMKNTFIIVILSTIGVVFSSALVAYSLARIQWPDRNLLFYVIVGTLMLPAQVTMIPVFLIFRNLGMIDTLWPLIIPTLLGNPFFIFLLRQFFMTLPETLFEAARIDGAGEMRCWVQLALPLSKPALLTVTIFSAMGAWNDFMGPLIYLSSESKKTLAVGLQTLQSQFGSEWGMLMAAATLMTVPVIILFFFAQRYFIEGIALTGMKG